LVKLAPTSNFADCAKATHSTAAELYGAGSKEQKAVASGWKKVGIKV
jgi:Zn-dependent metalloprotease